MHHNKQHSRHFSKSYLDKNTKLTHPNTKENKEKDDEFDFYQAEVARLTSENTRKNAIIYDQNQKLEEKYLEVRGYMQRNGELEQMNQQKDRKVFRLEGQLENERREHAKKLKEKKNENKVLLGSRNRQVGINVELEKLHGIHHDTVDKLVKQNSELKSKMEQLQKQFDVQKDQSDQTLRTEGREHQNQLDNLQEQVRAANRKIGNLETKLIEEKSQSDDALRKKNDEHQKQLNDLRKQVQKADEKIGNLETKLIKDGQEHQNQLQRHQNHNRELERDSKKFQDELELQKRKVVEMEEQKIKTDEAFKLQESKHAEQLGEANQKIKNLETELSKEKKRADENVVEQFQVTTLKLQKEQLAEKVRDLENQLADLSIRNATLEDEQVQKAIRAANQDNQMQHLTKKIEELKGELNVQNQKVLKLKEDLEDQKIKSDSELGKKDKEIKELEEKMDELDKRAKEDVDRYKTLFNANQEQYRELQDAIRAKNEANEAIGQADQIIQDLEKELEGKTAKIKNLSRSVLALATGESLERNSEDRSSSGSSSRKRSRTSSSTPGSEDGSPQPFLAPHSPAVHLRWSPNQFMSNRGSLQTPEPTPTPSREYQPTRRYRETPEPTPTPSRENSELRDPSYIPGMSIRSVWSGRSGGKTGKDRKF